MRQLTYLNHSGFLLELDRDVLVFDYFTDPANVLSRYTDSEKNIRFFVSHAHYDHWNLDILDFRSAGRQFYYLDESCQLPESFVPADYMQFFSMQPGRVLTDPADVGEEIKSIQTFGSTDEGVSYLLEISEGYIFHAGDLNMWDWEPVGKTDLAMEQAYTHELAALQQTLAGKPVWLAMLPVDLRLDKKAFLGAKMFTSYVKTQYLVPDHLNGGVQLPKLLARELNGETTQVIDLTTPGQSLAL